MCAYIALYHSYKSKRDLAANTYFLVSFSISRINGCVLFRYGGIFGFGFRLLKKSKSSIRICAELNIIKLKFLSSRKLSN